jgi:DNA polymerase delta subunit 2
MPAYEDVSDRFHLRRDGDDVGPQYASLYHCRAQQLGPRAVRVGNRAWGPTSDASPWTNTVNAQTLGATEGRIVGVLYRRMADPRIESRALKGTTGQAPELMRTRCHADDLLKLEDAAGRLALRFDADTLSDWADRLLSGSVVAVLGRYAPLASEEQGASTFQHDAGVFDVVDVCAPGPLAQPRLAPPLLHVPPRCVAIVSGLSIRSDDPSDGLAALLAGLVANATSGALARVIVAGNGASPWNTSQAGPPTDALAHLRGLDRFLAALADHVPVDYMCGADDIGPGALPQPPLFGALLPEATAKKGLRLCTNPYACTVGGYGFLGSAGQPVDDATVQLPPADREAGDASIRVLAQTLECGHMAPTAPGTLHCHALVHEDPFVIHERPHVYFAGNQPFGNEALDDEEHADEWTRLVAVPRYSETATVAIVALVDGCSCTFVRF